MLAKFSYPPPPPPLEVESTAVHVLLKKTLQAPLNENFIFESGKGVYSLLLHRVLVETNEIESVWWLYYGV